MPRETLQKYTARQKLQCKDHTGQIPQGGGMKEEGSKKEEQASQSEREDEQKSVTRPPPGHLYK